MVETAISTRAIEHLLSIAQVAGIGCHHDGEQVIKDFRSPRWAKRSVEMLVSISG
jgi:hypothetical protein